MNPFPDSVAVVVSCYAESRSQWMIGGGSIVAVVIATLLLAMDFNRKAV